MSSRSLFPVVLALMASAGTCSLSTTAAAQQPSPKSRDAELVLDLRIEPGAFARRDTTVTCSEPAPREHRQWLADTATARLRIGGADTDIPVQIDVLGESRDELVIAWVHPELEADRPVDVRLVIRRAASATTGFRIRDGEAYREISLGDRPVLRSTTAWDPARREQTYKVFDHLFGPRGEQLTKGPGGLFSHHRGVFMGWNQLRWGDQRLDSWHCSRGVAIRHVGFEDGAQSAGTVRASLCSIASWQLEDRAFVTERRSATAWRPTAGRQVFDYALALRAPDGAVQLRGDPHHAGFQVRLDQPLGEDDEPKVGFLRPESAEGQGNDIWTGCNWMAGSFVLRGRKYTLIHMDAPDNPRPIRYSTRPYGRFGSTFDADIDAEPLNLRYRLVLIDRQVEPRVSRQQCEELYRDFATPVRVVAR